MPFGPAGTRGTIFNPPETRGSYGPRALDCWYVGMHFQIPSTGGYQTSPQYKMYPTHVKILRETPMDRAVKIAGSLTTAIQNILKEPTKNTGRYGQAVENLAKIFENATENLETQQQNSAQTLSTPTTQANIRVTPRVHSRMTPKNTPGIIPTQPPTSLANTEGGEAFSPPISNSEGGQKSVRKRNSKPRSSEERKKLKQRIDPPEESGAHQRAQEKKDMKTKSWQKNYQRNLKQAEPLQARLQKESPLQRNPYSKWNR